MREIKIQRGRERGKARQIKRERDGESGGQRNRYKLTEGKI